MRYFFTGIKGTGMSALAQILKDEGYEVAGSDIEKYVFTQDGLLERGIEILPFDADNIQPGDTVIVGLSFGREHPEAARALAMDDVQVYWYNEFLGRLIEDYESICVAGCHGKSTTTGLLAHVLEADRSTGYLIGDGHGKMPKGAQDFVLESCEFQRHFLAYHPQYAIITNIELDHADYYKDLDDYISAFQSFVNQVSKECVIFHDDPYLKDLHYPCSVVSYGLEEGSTYRGVHLEETTHGTELDVEKDGRILCHLSLPESGMPFAWDSLGVFAMASELGMQPEAIKAGLESFQGIARRFVIEEHGDSVLVDDYAHHPTAIREMIHAVRHRYPDKKVVALYKPDRYSRLQVFLDRFGESLNEADAAYVLDFDPNIKPESPEITVTIDSLLERLDHGALLDISRESAQRLYEEGDAVYLFMSSKNIYLLKDLLAEVIDEAAKQSL